MSRPPQFTTEDLRRYDELKERVRGNLRSARAQSDLLIRIGADMLAAVDEDLWQIDTAQEAPTPAKWAAQVFEMSERQARKYLTVAGALREDEAAGMGLCLDRLYQVALAPAGLRPCLIELGQMGLSAESLSAGRRRAEGQTDMKRAAAVAAQAAKQHEKGQDGAESADDKAVAAPVQQAKTQLRRAGGQIDRIDERDPAQATPLGEVVERLQELLRAAQAKHQRCLEHVQQLKAQERAKREETSSQEQDEAVAGQVARKETSAGLLLVPPVLLPADAPFAPLINLVRTGLPRGQDEVLRQVLTAVMKGADPAQMAAEIASLAEDFERQGVDNKMIEEWRGKLCDPTWERRSTFALANYNLGHLPGYRALIKELREQEDIPYALRQAVERSWWRIVCKTSDTAKLAQWSEKSM